MSLTPARRRRIDRLVAAALALVVAGVAALVYLTSDIRATTLDAGPEQAAPDAPVVVPSALSPSWQLATDPELGAVASPYGVVVTATDRNTVVGSDAVTGAQRWSFSRENLTLCALGSGDTDARGVTTRGRVRGVMTVFEKGGSCSQVRLLDPVTGERHYDRSSPGQIGGALAFGGPYAAWLGPDLLELWRDDLVRTIQYGNQPQPTKAETLHTGCLFSDIALADTQFATIEHCAAGGGARLVINWATPDSAPNKPDGQDVFKHDPRADIDTGSPAARIVGITQDRVAVLVSAPEPAVVVYDATGTETSRTPVGIPAQDIVDADMVPTAPGTQGAVPVRVTPSVQADDVRYSLVGTTLLAVSQNQIQVPAPPISMSATTSAVPSASGSVGPSRAFGSAGGALGSAVTDSGGTTTGTGASAGAEPPATVSVRDLTLRWTTDQARGLPALIGDAVLVPVDAGLEVLAEIAGTPRVVPGTADTTVLPVDRGGWTGRVDAAAVGSVVVETRGGTVVGLS